MKFAKTNCTFAVTAALIAIMMIVPAAMAQKPGELVDDPPASGPFKVIIPGVSSAPATSPAPVVAEPKPEPAAEPAKAAVQPAVATPTAATPVIREVRPEASAQEENPCIAGCYKPTGARADRQIPKRVERPVAGNPSADVTPREGEVLCVAGCDGVGGVPLRRAPANQVTVAGSEAASASAGGAESGTGKVTILRGVARTKTYGVGQ